MTRHGLTPVERIRRRIELVGHPTMPSPCWIFKGSLNRAGRDGGYGQIGIEGSTRYTHRVMYESEIGEIPTGLVLDHLCRRPACCNPAHLEPVAQRVNLLRGDTVVARAVTATHCAKGHLLVDDRTRRCSTCARRYRREYKRARRERGVPHDVA